MANPEHLAILKQGVQVWNQWREQSNVLVPDLREALLHGESLINADFSRCSLQGARLQQATLTGVNLTEANLTRAELTSTDLRSANASRSSCPEAIFFRADLQYSNFHGARAYMGDFRSANLTRADFSDSDLSVADLRNADLTCARFSSAEMGGANLSGAILAGTNLAGAIVWHTVFGDLNLSKAVGLESINHRGPSVLDVATLFRSLGQLPESFLAGVGVPTVFIDYSQSLVNQPIQFYSSFISYSSHDQAIANQLYRDLRHNRVRCWLATEDLKIGDQFRQRIDESICFHDKLLLILSEHSVNSPWVQDEVEAALERERREGRCVLFPIRIDDAVMTTNKGWAASIRRTRHIGDFSNWKDHDSYQIKGFEGGGRYRRFGKVIQYGPIAIGTDWNLH